MDFYLFDCVLFVLFRWSLLITHGCILLTIPYEDFILKGMERIAQTYIIFTPVQI